MTRRLRRLLGDSKLNEYGLFREFGMLVSKTTLAKSVPNVPSNSTGGVPGGTSSVMGNIFCVLLIFGSPTVTIKVSFIFAGDTFFREI